MMILHDNPKDEFILNIALRSAINAAVQIRRHPVFSESVTLNKDDNPQIASEKRQRKTSAIAFWKEKLEQHAWAYLETAVDYQYFINDVDKLKNEINAEYRDCFSGNGIRIGQCQKSLSVFLKWLWCWGKCTIEPPVCPIDRRVLVFCYDNELDKSVVEDKEWRKLIAKVNKAGGWGQLDDLNDYAELVKMTRIISSRHQETVAYWELRVFNDNVLEDSSELFG